MEHLCAGEVVGQMVKVGVGCRLSGYVVGANAQKPEREQGHQVTPFLGREFGDGVIKLGLAAAVRLGHGGNSIGSLATTSEHHRQFKDLSSAGSGLIKVETAQHAGWPLPFRNGFITVFCAFRCNSRQFGTTLAD
jgi:hypothetical protein